MALARMRANTLSRCRDLKPLGHGFLGLNTLWTSHTLTIKRARNIEAARPLCKRHFAAFVAFFTHPAAITPPNPKRRTAFPLEPKSSMADALIHYECGRSL